MRKLCIALAFALWLPACGGGDDPDSPAAKCEALLDLLCERIGECMFGGYTVEQCQSEVAAATDCGDVDRISSTYDSCMAMLDSLACPELFPAGSEDPLPLECHDVIILE